MPGSLLKRSPRKRLPSDGASRKRNLRAVMCAPAASVFVVVGLLVSGCGDGAKKTAQPAGKQPEQAVKAAFGRLSSVNSGTFTFEMTVSGGGMPGNFKFTGDGGFDTKADGGRPAAEINMAMDLGGQKQQFGFTSVDDKAYVKLGDRAFAVGDGKLGATQSTGKIDPADLRDFIKSLDAYLGEVKPAGTSSIDGTPLNVYSADFDSKKAAAKAQADAKGKLPEVPGLGSSSALANMLGDTVVRVGVDGSEIPRLLEVESAFGATGNNSGSLKLTLKLMTVNEPVKIEKPKNVVEGENALDMLGGMFGGLGGPTR